MKMENIMMSLRSVDALCKITVDALRHERWTVETLDKTFLRIANIDPKSVDYKLSYYVYFYISAPLMMVDSEGNVKHFKLTERDFDKIGYVYPDVYVCDRGDVVYIIDYFLYIRKLRWYGIDDSKMLSLYKELLDWTLDYLRKRHRVRRVYVDVRPVSEIREIRGDDEYSDYVLNEVLSRHYKLKVVDPVTVEILS